jgi:hypothetical protein
MKVSRRFGEAGSEISIFFTLVSCLSHSLTLKIEAIYSTEISVDFQRTTRRYVSKTELLITTSVKTYILSDRYRFLMNST